MRDKYLIFVNGRPSGKLYEMNAGDLVEVDSVSAGNIACIVGLKNTRTGHTLLRATDKVAVYRINLFKISFSTLSNSPIFCLTQSFLRE